MAGSRQGNQKKRKQEKLKGALGPFWLVGCCVDWAQTRTGIIEQSVWCLLLCLNGPKSVVGPHSKFRESGYVQIILMSDLGNFRRLREYINIVP